MSFVLTLCLLGIGVDMFAAVTGNGTAASPFVISTTDDWNTVTSNFGAGKTYGNDKYYELGADLDFDKVPFCPLGGWYFKRNKFYTSDEIGYHFQGHFDGKGHKISNINTDGTYEPGYFGVFGYVNKGVVKNLVVENFVMSKQSKSFGGIVGLIYNQTLVENCYVINPKLSCNGGGDIFIGGICGEAKGTDPVIRNCGVYNADLTQSNNSCIGGILGYSAESGTIENCYANVNFSKVYNNTGGLIGFLQLAHAKTYNVTNSFATGSITLVNGEEQVAVGGLCGNASNAHFTNCGADVDIVSLNGTTTNAVHQLGGFIGNADYACQFTNCYAAGSFSFKEFGSNNSGVNYFAGEFNSTQSASFGHSTYVNCYAADNLFPGNESRFPTPGVSGFYAYPTPDEMSAALKAESYLKSEAFATLLNDNANGFLWTYCSEMNDGFPYPASCAYLDLLVAMGEITETDKINISTRFDCPAGACITKYDTVRIEDCDKVVFNSITYTYDTKIRTELKTSNGCDSIVITEIKVLKPIKKTEEVSVCKNSVYKSFYITKDTTITSKFVAVNGCDSIVETSVKVIKPVVTEKSENVCVGQTFRGVVINDNVTFTDSLKSLTTGCDSIVITNVIAKKLAEKSFVVDACGSYLLNGVEYVSKSDDAITTYSDVRDTVNCDYIGVYTIRVHPAAQVVREDMKPFCDSYTLKKKNGASVVVSSVPSLVHDTLKSKICDCDSIIFIYNFESMGSSYLKDLGDNLASVDLFGCQSSSLVYERPASVYNPAKTMNFKFESSATAVKYDTLKTFNFGCDSLVRINLTFDAPHSAIVDLGDICYSDEIVIAGQTIQVPEDGGIKIGSVSETISSTTGGCDTVKTYKYKVHGLKTIKYPVVNVTESSYELVTESGNTYLLTESKIVEETQKSKNSACDSVLHVYRVNFVSTKDVYACDGFFNGKKYDENTTVFDEETGTYYKINIYNNHGDVEGKTYKLQLGKSGNETLTFGDDQVNVVYTDSSFSLTDPSGKVYVVNRGDKLITDQIVYKQPIKSKICDCDSVYFPIKVSFLSYVTTQDVAKDCWAYEYTRLDGKVAHVDSFTFQKWTEVLPEPGFVTVVYRDTLFDSSDSISGRINLLRYSHYRTAMLEDRSYDGTWCDKKVFRGPDGTRETLLAEDYLEQKLKVFEYHDDPDTQCPSSLTAYYIQAKGLSEFAERINIGSRLEPENLMPASIENPNGVACDTVLFNGVPVVEDLIDYKQSFNANSSHPCGFYNLITVTVNHSVVTDTTIHGCGVVEYVDHNNVSHQFTESCIFKDVKKHVVPVCKCDSIWMVNVVVHSTDKDTINENSCSEYVYRYLDVNKSNLTLSSDTSFSDTLDHVCDVCKKNELVCHSKIRFFNFKRLENSVSKDTVDEGSHCNFYYFYKHDNSELVVKNDTIIADTLVAVNGCDSIAYHKINILHSGKRDSSFSVQTDLFTYNDENGKPKFVEVTKDIVNISYINYKKNEENDCIDTINYHVTLHPLVKIAPDVVHKVLCDVDTFVKYNGDLVVVRHPLVEVPFVFFDTLRSKVSGYDSLIRKVSYLSSAHAYTLDNTPVESLAVALDTFTCVSNTVIYNRDTTFGNLPFSYTFPHPDSKTVTYFDKMQSSKGCDSVVVAKVTYDSPHIIGTAQNFEICANQLPVAFAGDTIYSVTKDSSIQYRNMIRINPEGGCDTTVSLSNVRIHAVKHIDKDTMKGCKLNESQELSYYIGKECYKIKSVGDTVVVRPAIKSKVCDCDSVVETYVLHTGMHTPVSNIDTFRIVGCSSVTIPANQNSKEQVWNFEPTTTYPVNIRLPFVNVTGCDSVVPTSVTINEPKFTLVRKTVCGYFSYTDLNHELHRIPRKGNVQTDSVYKDTVVYEGMAANGCDTTVYFDVTIRPLQIKTVNYTGCGYLDAVAPADSLDRALNDMPKREYKAINEPFDTTFFLPNVNTCDISYNVHIHVNPVYHHSHVVEKCKSASLLDLYKACPSNSKKDLSKIEDKVFDKDTVVVFNNVSSFGCDSVDTFKIIVHPVLIENVTYDSCGVVELGNKVYLRSATTRDTVKYVGNSCGCDSVIYINDIVVRKRETLNIDIDSCRSMMFNSFSLVDFDRSINADIFEMNNDTITYSKSAKYRVYAGASSNGCDSIITYSLNVQNCYPYPVIINKYNWILGCNLNYVGDGVTGYQWYKVDPEAEKEQLILNANESYYTENKELTGCFKVVVSYGDSLQLSSEAYCIDTVNTVSLKYELYPDPVKVNEPVFLTCNFDCEGSVVEVFNALGIKVFKTVASSRNIEIPAKSHPAPGYYFVRMTTTDNVVFSVKFLVSSK